MKIEIKNLKHAEFASEETLCYQGTIYVDGVRAILANNDGRGGADYYWPVKDTTHAREAFDKAVATIAKHCETLPDRTFESGGETHSYAVDMEGLVNELVNNTLTLRDIKRNFGKKLCFKLPTHADGQYSYFPMKNKTSLPALRAHILKEHPEAVILNDLDGDKLIEAVG